LSERPLEPFPVLRAPATATVPPPLGGSPFPDLRAPAAPRGGPAGEAPAELEAARRLGYEAGVAAGRAAAEQELLGAARGFAEALAELASFRAGLLERYQRELLELALGIARKVVQRELAANPEHWLGMLREAVRQALDRERIRIRVGGVLHRFLLEHLPDLRAQLEDVKELELVEDATLAENGCVLESRYGDLDLSVDTQIGAIRAALTRGE
jgi:flagellar assembly protein FliH